MVRFALLAAASTVALVAMPAAATTLTFENAGAVGTFLGNNVIDSGFQVNASDCDGPQRCFQVATAPTQGSGSAGKVLESKAYNPVLTFSQVGGAAFTLQSFALTGIELSAPFLTNFDVVFRFNYADGTQGVLGDSVLADFSNPISVLFDSSRIGSFTSKTLTSFSIAADYDSQAGARLQIDNVTVTSAAAVPEPATWAMFIGGFGMVGGALRRRQRTSVRFA